ncbi:MAG: hypothetical protein GYB67_04115 [Chloroflexi bacterium]|nr:hypothetical protein [Chloroflexota bacterium]
MKIDEGTLELPFVPTKLRKCYDAKVDHKRWSMEMPRITQRRCFIIGPMKDASLGRQARLNKIKFDVIEPLLNEIAQEENYQIQYIVENPYDLGGNHIMNDVIYAIDRADIVIADLTFSNANVFYELGITHALGRPCLSVLEASQHYTEFDIRAYRYYSIDMDNNKHDEAKNTLRKALRTAHRDVDWSRFENPVIDFFRAPITYISPAYALAQGYYRNFVLPVVEAMINRKGKDAFIYDIGTTSKSDLREVSVEETDILPVAARSKLKLNIIIPERITYARRDYADRFRDQMLSAVVESAGRNFTCWYRSYDDGAKIELVDLATTMSSMLDAIQRRMRFPANPDFDSPEWREIEKQEVERFVLNLQMLINAHERNPVFKDAITITRYDPDTPTEHMWIHNILQ